MDCIETLIENKYIDDVNQLSKKVASKEYTEEENKQMVLKIMELNANIQTIRRKRHVKKTSN